MVATKMKVAFALYAPTVAILFMLIGRHLATPYNGHADILEYAIAVISAPGVFVAVFLIGGIHSASFDNVTVISNITIYLAVPLLLWAWRTRKRRTAASRPAAGAG